MSSHISSFLAPVFVCGVGLIMAWRGLLKWQAGDIKFAIALVAGAVAALGYAIFAVAPSHSAAGGRVVRAWGEGADMRPLSFRMPAGCDTPVLQVLPTTSPALEIPSSGVSAPVSWSGMAMNAAPIRCEHGPGVPALVKVIGHVTVKSHPSWTALVSIVVDEMQTPDGKPVEFTAPEPIDRPHVPL